MVQQKEGGDFKCTGCHGTKKQLEDVRRLFKRLREETDALLNDPERNSIAQYEKFLSEHSDVLHPNNLLMVRLRYRLCGMYGREPGYQASSFLLPREALASYPCFFPGFRCPTCPRCWWRGSLGFASRL